jgi:hypothetical protein
LVLISLLPVLPEYRKSLRTPVVANLASFFEFFGYDQGMSEKSRKVWDRIPPEVRKPLIWILWFVTWTGLVAGLFDRTFFEYVVFFSAAHAVLFLALFGFNVTPFPVQVRIAYFIWVAVGTYVPYLGVLMYITLVGLATNIFLGYCPLARMMYLMPWNRNEKFSLGLIKRVFFSPPVVGKFEPAARSSS